MKLPSIGKARSAIYKSGKILGDINAVKKGTVTRRITARVSGNVTSRILKKLVRLIAK